MAFEARRRIGLSGRGSCVRRSKSMIERSVAQEAINDVSDGLKARALMVASEVDHFKVSVAMPEVRDKS